MNPGQPAPSFTIKAIVTGRTFRLDDYRGRPVVLLFVDHNTGRDTREVVIGLRRHFPDFDRLPIAIIIDLHLVPAIFRGIAQRVIETAYQSASADVPSGFDPADHLILLPDWTGAVAKAYGVGDVSRRMKFYLVDPEGKVRHVYQGPDVAAKAIALTTPLLADSR